MLPGWSGMNFLAQPPTTQVSDAAHMRSMDDYLPYALVFLDRDDIAPSEK